MTLRLSAKAARALGLTVPSEAKFGNKSTIVDGVRFDSAFEANHWSVLQLRLRAGEIRSLRRQVTFRLMVNGQHVTSMRLDFVYEEQQGGRWVPVYEDAKSKPTTTEAWAVRAKLFRALFGQSIRIVTQRQ